MVPPNGAVAQIAKIHPFTCILYWIFPEDIRHRESS